MIFTSVIPLKFEEQSNDGPTQNQIQPIFFLTIHRKLNHV